MATAHAACLIPNTSFCGTAVALLIPRLRAVTLVLPRDMACPISCFGLLTAERCPFLPFHAGCGLHRGQSYGRETVIFRASTSLNAEGSTNRQSPGSRSVWRRDRAQQDSATRSAHVRVTWAGMRLRIQTQKGREVARSMAGAAVSTAGVRSCVRGVGACRLVVADIFAAHAASPRVAT